MRQQTKNERGKMTTYLKCLKPFSARLWGYLFIGRNGREFYLQAEFESFRSKRKKQKGLQYEVERKFADIKGLQSTRFSFSFLILPFSRLCRCILFFLFVFVCPYHFRFRFSTLSWEFTVFSAIVSQPLFGGHVQNKN